MGRKTVSGFAARPVGSKHTLVPDSGMQYSYDGVERFLQVLQDIVNVFGADGQTDGSRPDTLFQKLGLI